MASGSGSGRGSVPNEYLPQYPYDAYNNYAEFNPFGDVPEPEPEPTMMQAEPTIDYSTTVTGPSQTRAKSSIIWEHFTRIQKPEDGGTKKFQLCCKHCPMKYMWRLGDGYGSMRKHLNDKHADKLGVATNQTRISSYGTGAPPFLFNLNVYKEELARFIAVEHLSFRFAERIGLLNFLQRGVNPQAVRISRNTVRRTINKLYCKEKDFLIKYFESFNGHVHIGSDVWSDHWCTHHYMGITCHWIDDDWNLQKRILAYRVFDSKHTAHNICRMITTILQEYCLSNKVFSIGFDNAASNTASLPELIKICKPIFGDKFFHIRCACHVLNLCVQSGLKVLDIFLKPIKDAIQFLWSHPNQMRAWLQFCRDNGMRKRRFSRDVPTRWNSTYTLLNETIPYKNLLIKFMEIHVPTMELYPSMWLICEKILDVLATFNNATFTLSGVYYPTTHLFIVEANNIAGILDVDPYIEVEEEGEEEANTRKTICEAMKTMRQKWLFYYKSIPMIYLVGCVFDPRVKIDGLRDFLVTYYTSLNMCDYNFITDKVDEVKAHIVEIYNDFSRRYNIDVPMVGSSSSTPNISVDRNRTRGWNILFNRRKNKGVEVGANGCFELESYLNVDFELDEGDDTTFDLLGWWKRHINKYPILSIIAKQVLATPCSTVAVEQAFSAGGNILDEQRSSLLPESLEMQTCLDDWTKAEVRQQEIDRQNYEFFDDEEGDTTTTANED